MAVDIWKAYSISVKYDPMGKIPFYTPSIHCLLIQKGGLLSTAILWWGSGEGTAGELSSFFGSLCGSKNSSTPTYCLLDFQAWVLNANGDHTTNPHRKVVEAGNTLLTELLSLEEFSKWSLPPLSPSQKAATGPLTVGAELLQSRVFLLMGQLVFLYR